MSRMHPTATPDYPPIAPDTANFAPGHDFLGGHLLGLPCHGAADMRLLLVVAAMRHGGAERIVVQLAADAVRRGNAVTVASAGGPWVEQVLEAGAGHELVALDRRSALATLGAVGRLALVVRRFRPEIVHAQNVRATVAAALALVGPGRRPALLTTLHGLAPRDYPAAAGLLRLAGGKVIACAPSVGRSLLAAGFPVGRLEVIRH